MMLRLKQILLLLVPTLLLLACDQTQQTQTDNQSLTNTVAVNTKPFVISGVSSKGPIQGANINVFAMDANGNKTGPTQATTTTDNNGFWSVSITPTPTSILLVESSGGSYIDEADPAANKRKIDLNPTEIIEGVLFPGQSTASITLLTDALLEKSRNESTSTDIQTVLFNNRNNAIAGLGFDPFGVAATDPVAPSVSASNDSIEYAMYLGGIATSLNSAAIILGKPVPDYAMMMAMVEDLSDGRLNGVDSNGVVTLDVDGSQRDFPDTLDLNQAILRFRNNNFQAYAATPIQAPVIVNETALAQPGTNTFPIAGDDLATTSSNTNVTIANVLDNDIDADGDALTTAIGTQPENGSITSTSNGVFVYVPNAGFSGSDAFTYSIDDGRGGTDTASVIINVQQTTIPVAPVNSSPTANAGANQNVLEQSTVTLTGSATDSDGTISTVLWTQQSGTNVTLTAANTNTLTFEAPTLTVAENLEFSFTVTDNEGAVGTDSVFITVNPVNAAPTADAGTNQSVLEESAVNLDSGVNTADIDGSIATFQWNQLSGTAVNITGANTNSASFTAPTITAVEVLLFGLVVTDNEGLSATDTVTVIVSPVNAPPTANAGVDQSVDEQTSVTLTGAGTDTDGTIASVQWSQVGGTTVNLTGANTSTASFTAPVVLINNLDALVFQLLVTDNEGIFGVDFVSVLANPVLVAPTANAGSDISVNEQTLVTLSGSGTDDGSISFAWTQLPGSPAVTLTGANTASPSFTGPDIANDTIFTFQLTVTDNEGGSATDTVDITLISANVGPTLVDDPVNTTPEDTPLVITTLLNNDTDPGNNLPITIDTVTQPANGTVVIEANNLDVTYTPNPNFNGTDTFTYTALDSLLANSTNSATVTVSVSGVNDNPVAVADTGSVVQGFPLTISNLTANDTDPENDPLSITGVTQPANGVSVNNGDGTVTYTPDLTFNGADSFTYSIVDGNGGSAIGVVNVSVIADSDGDGETDTQEGIDGTNPNLADSDNDGFFDGHEKLVGTNPNLNTEFPPNPLASSIISTANANNSITVDTTWSLANSPYLVLNDVNISATLTIEPGVVVKLANTVDIRVNAGGILDAQGNAPVPQQVVFTSDHDDSINGDTNGDGGATTAGGGDWAGIDYNLNSSGSLRNAIVRNAGSCIQVINSSPVLDNVDVGDCTGFGIQVQTTTGTRNANLSSIDIIDFNGNGRSTNSHGIYIEAFSAATVVLDIKDVTITDPADSTNEFGLYVLSQGGNVNGTIDNVSVVNPSGDGLNILNNSNADVNVALSNISVTGAGVNSLDVRATSTGLLNLTFDGTQNFINSGVTTPTSTAVYFENNDPDFLATGSMSIDSAGYGMNLNSSDGNFRNININNVSVAGLILQNANNPAVFSNVVLTNAPTPYEIRGQDLTPAIIAGYDFTDASVDKLFIRITGSLLADTTLGVDPLASGNSVWRVPGGLTVPTGVTLTVNDGAILKFDLNQTLTVNGNLIVGDGDGLGANAVFTSIRDDSVGAVIDATDPAAARNDWNYIFLGNGSSLNMDNATLSYMDRGIYQNFTAPVSFSITNTDITEFINYGMDLITTTDITYTVNTVNISNGSNQDGIRITDSGTRAITVDFDNVTIDNVGNDTNDRGIELFFDENSTLTGRLDNITVSNTSGTGILLQNTTSGLVNPVFSGLNITNPGLYGLQLIGNSDGFTSPTVDDSFNPGVATNLIGDASPGSGGVYGMLLQGVNGKYDHITISNTTSSSLFLSGVNNPTPWDDATIVLNESPAPWTIRTTFPSSIGVLGGGSTDLGYTAGTGLVENYVQLNSSLVDTTLVANPLNTGSVWRVDTSVTIPTGVTLTVEDGAIIKFNLNQTLFVDGTLIVGDGDGIGPDAVFTSVRDDSVGAVIDATDPAAARNDWNWIELRNGSTLNMDNATIRFMDRGILQNFTSPLSFTVTNTDISEFINWGMDLITNTDITYTVNTVNISNGSNQDGIRITDSGTRAITVDFDNVTIDNVGNDNTDRGIEFFFDENSTLTGRLDNITVNNTFGTGILLQNTTGGLVNPVFSGLNITNPGLYGLQLVGNSDGFTQPTVDNSCSPPTCLTPPTNFIGNPSVADSGGVYGMLIQGVNGTYNNITISNTFTTVAANSPRPSALFISGVTNPAVWDDASIILNNTASPWTMRTTLPASIGVLNTADLGYTPGTGLVQSYVQLNSTISDMNLVADPLNTGSSVWRADLNVTVPAGVTLSIDDGAIVKFDSNILMLVNGSLTIGDGDGLGANAILTSIRDDSIGDDLGDATPPARGNWNTIQPATNSIINIDNAIIRYPQYGVLSNNGSPATFSVSNSIFTEFLRYGLYLDPNGTITYTLTNNTISNGTLNDGLFLFANTGDAVTLNIDGLNIDNVGDGTDNRGMFLDINGTGTTMAGNLFNITVTNSFGSGIVLDDDSTGIVNPVFSGLDVSNAGLHGIQLLGTGDGTTTPSMNAVAGPNLIGDPLIVGSGGDLGLTFQGVNGTYSDITINSNSLSALYFSNNADPTFGANITLDNSPAPYSLVGMALPAGVAYTSGANLVEDYVRIFGDLLADLTLDPEPLGAGSGSYWRVAGIFRVPAATTLTIAAGTILKFESGFQFDIQNGGTLNVNGTNTNHVVMTSTTDNDVGNGNSALLVDWEGLNFNAGSAGTINFLDIWYARDGIDLVNVTSNPVFNDLAVNYCQDGLRINSTTGMTLTFNNLSLNENSSNHLVLEGNGSLSTTFTEDVPGGLSIIDISGNGADATHGIFISNTDSTNVVSGFTISGTDNPIRLSGAGANIVDNNIIRQADFDGINHTATGNPIIRNNVIVNNGGAGILVSGGNGNILGNLIRQNSRHSGGGIHITDFSAARDVTMENNLIIENRSTSNTSNSGGSGIYVTGSAASPTIINNTIANNLSADTAGFEGAGINIESSGGTVTLTDNIIFGNTDIANGTNDLYDDVGRISTASNNLIGTLLASPGSNLYTADVTDIIGSDPLFVQGWYLSALDIQGPQSPAIDAGSANATAILPIPLDSRTTRTDGGLDGIADGAIVNVGYHYAGANIPASASNTTVVSSPVSPVTTVSGTPVVITITPRDGLSGIIGAGLIVEAQISTSGAPSTGTITSTGTNSTMSMVRDLGDGSYEVTFTPDGGSAGTDTISFTVNGVAITTIISVTWTIT